MKPLVVVVGDSLLDRDHRGFSQRLAPDAPVPVIEQASTTARPGGAALAAMILLGLDVEVEILTALADDIDGLELAETLQSAGVRVHGLRATGQTRTKERVFAGEQVIARMDRGGARMAPVDVDRAQVEQIIERADAILVSDYGGGMLMDPAISAALRRTDKAIVWDPHPRGAVPVPGCRVITPNEHEARHFSGEEDPASILEVADSLRRAWFADSVAVTLGSRGATLVASGTALFAPTTPVSGDPSGAGDAFAAAVVRAIAVGATLESAMTSAVAFARDWVGRSTRRSESRSRSAVRAAGGRIVATGGCFDLLHPGHLATLRGARQLGEYLVVCINSDASVRALKGATRPFVSQDDRKALLEALEMVDEVLIFDEATPEEILRTIKPDIWVKGGDYDPQQLVERDVIAEWGGELVIVPYLPGHSTTRLADAIGSVIDIRGIRQEQL